MKVVRHLVLALTLAFAIAPEAKATTRYTVDSVHSEVSFSIRHLVTKVRGIFREFQGTIVYDKNNPENSSVEFRIQAASIDTNNAKRDEHLRSPDFFEVAKFPEIVFVSKRVEKAGDQDYRVTGELTLHGVTKVITLPVTFDGEVKDPWGNVKAGFSTQYRLNRKDFGIHWNQTLDTGGLLLGDEVDVTIHLEVQRAS